MNRKICAFFLVFCVLICLTSCGKTTVKQKNADGTVTKIEYRNASPFKRTPYFEQSGTALCMTFNGITWYEASVIDNDTAEWVSEGKLIAESSNVRVYEANPHAEYEYAYLMKLNGTEEACILFYSDDLPGQGYGSDFTTSIRYFTDDTETVPDLDYTMSGEEQ